MPAYDAITCGACPSTVSVTLPAGARNDAIANLSSLAARNTSSIFSWPALHTLLIVQPKESEHALCESVQTFN